MNLILTDTCFWTHVKDVYDSLQIDLREVLDNFRWGTTKAIQAEIEARKLTGFFHVDQGYLIPVSDVEIATMIRMVPMIAEFDYEDQTLIVAAIREKATVLTDDGALFLECQALSLETMQLPHFCLQLTKASLLDKTSVYQMLRHWNDTSRFASRFIKRWKKDLQAISGAKE
jgi:hypothetical protein